MKTIQLWVNVGGVPDDADEGELKQQVEEALTTSPIFKDNTIDAEVQDLGKETDALAKTMPDKSLPDEKMFRPKDVQDNWKKRKVAESIAEQDLEDGEQDKLDKKAKDKKEVEAYERRVNEYIRGMSQEEKDVVLGIFSYASPEVRISKLSEHAIEKIEADDRDRESRTNPKIYSERENLYGRGSFFRGVS